MSIKFSIAILLFALTGLSAKAQTRPVGLLTIQQLEKRIRNPDTVYIVNFWATWCGPCVKELPGFEQLQKNYKTKPLKVLLVSMDFKSKLTEIKAFAQARKYSSEIVLADRQSDQEFIDKIDKKWSGALPGTLVVNGKKHFRQFYEREFTYAELNKLYQTHQ